MLKWLWLSAVVIVLDQYTKWLASTKLHLFERVEILPIFNFTLAHNTGAAFSFLSDAGGWQRWFFTVLAIGVSIFIVFWLKKLRTDERATAISLTLILGGAIGNVIDRIRLGYVVDFLDFHWGDAHWPAFNIADSAIFVGAVILVALSFFTSEKSDSKETGKNG